MALLLGDRGQEQHLEGDLFVGLATGVFGVRQLGGRPLARLSALQEGARRETRPPLPRTSVPSISQRMTGGMVG